MSEEDDDAYMKMVIRQETEEKFNELEAKIIKLIDEAGQNEETMTQFSQVNEAMAQSSAQLESFNTRITELEDRVNLIEKQLKLVVITQQGQESKPKKNKWDDPAYPEFHNFLTQK